MFRIGAGLTVFGLAAGAGAQLISVTNAYENAYVTDSLYTYDSSYNVLTTYDSRLTSNTAGPGSNSLSQAGAWSVALSNGVTSGAGESALAFCELTNGADGASFDSVFTSNAQVATTETGPPAGAFGVAGGALGWSESDLEFQVLQPTQVSVSGLMTHFGAGSGESFYLFDMTTPGVVFSVSDSGAGLNLDLTSPLTVGDTYMLRSAVAAVAQFHFDGSGVLDETGTAGANGYVDVAFAPPPTPEPATVCALGLGALALVRRRQR